MRNQKCKLPNALKHGAFAAIAILPGEDPREFEELHSSLVEEWMPDGATEEDAVLGLAKDMWRKRRVQKFISVRFLKSNLDPNHPLYHAAGYLMAFATAMKREPDAVFQEDASSILPADKIKYLEQKFPRSDFKSAGERAQAIMDEIYASMTETNIETDRIAALFHSSVAVSNDLFKQELALEECLDVMIDRKLKRLIQTKAMKQMLAQTGAQRADEQPDPGVRLRKRRQKRAGTAIDDPMVAGSARRMAGTDHRKRRSPSRR